MYSCECAARYRGSTSRGGSPTISALVSPTQARTSRDLMMRGSHGNRWQMYDRGRYMDHQYEPLIRKVDCVQIQVPNLDAGLAFYRDQLGHQLVWRTESAVGL